MKEIVGIFVAVVIIGAVVFGLHFAGFISYSFWAPKYENVRRDVYENSRASHEGHAREIYRIKLQYQQATSEQERATLKSFARHELDGFDAAQLPADLQDFVKEMRN